MAMTRFQIYLDPEQDKVLAREARRRKVSKASLIREAIDRQFVKPQAAPDPIDALIGDSPGEVGDIDEVVYGR